MAVRIYSLAKELKLDSKVLVDICTSAGVTGKGSALASLTEEEVARVKAYMGGGAGARAKAPASKAPVGSTAMLERAADPSVLRREDYIAPGGAGADRVPDLADKKPKPTVQPRKGDGEGPQPRPQALRPAAIKLPPLPPSAQPVTPPPVEIAPQKPELKLPPEAIRAASKGGATPLSEHLRKHEKRRKEAADTEVPSTPAARGPVSRDRGRKDVAPVGTPEPGRGRRTKSGVPAPQGEGDAALLGGREQRQLNRKRGPAEPRRRGEDEESQPSRRRLLSRNRRAGVSTAAPRKSKATLTLPCTVRSFSEAVGMPAQQVIKHLLGLGTMANINAEIAPETAELLALELGVEVDFKREVSFVDEQLAALQSLEDDPALMVPRPPVITFLGHVDHGKTSLLDRIIGINVASGESGGITQHIRAYQIEKDGRRISFVDTPGHEAFTEMRARGANVTDIAVLVVAADDGVMPQTEEAISHARAAGVPIVVAMNKIDLPGVDPQRIYQQLAANELLPSEWGGDTEVVKTSATKGDGIDELLETLLTLAELHHYVANPNRAATGTSLESELHEGRGVVAKLIVQTGTLRVGDAMVCGTAYGRVKAMYDTLNPTVTYTEVGPSMPVHVTGFDVAPGAGEHFFVLENIATAREIAAERERRDRRASLSGAPTHVTLENLFDRLGENEVQTLNLILRADVRGSIEAIEKELGKLEHPEVKIKTLQRSVGGITEGDIQLAHASDAVVIGFNVVPDEGARQLADRLGVQVRRYEIIYKLTEDLKKALEGMLEPEEREVELGRALVQRTFTISRVGTIAGCRVLAGTIQRNCRIRVIRENRVIGIYPLESLKREKDDAKEVREGLECGMKLANFNDLKEGDVLEAYKIEEVARTF